MSEIGFVEHKSICFPKALNICLTLNILMGFKTMTVTDDAYELAKRLKLPNESFTEWIRRLGKKQLLVSDIPGIVKMSDEAYEETKTRMAAWRKSLDEGMTRRVERVRSRLKRAH